LGNELGDRLIFLKAKFDVPEIHKYFGEVFKLLRHKQSLVVHQLSDERVLEPDFADHALSVFSAMKPFFAYLQPLAGQQMRPAGKVPKRKREPGARAARADAGTVQASAARPESRKRWRSKTGGERGEG
jgi:hypothetical protein